MKLAISKRFYTVAGVLLLIFGISYAEVATFLSRLTRSLERRQQVSRLYRAATQLQRNYWELRYWEREVLTSDKKDADDRFAVVLQAMKAMLPTIQPLADQAGFTQNIPRLAAELNVYEHDFSELNRASIDLRLSKARLVVRAQTLIPALLNLNDSALLPTLLNFSRFHLEYFDTRDLIARTATEEALAALRLQLQPRTNAARQNLLVDQYGGLLREDYTLSMHMIAAALKLEAVGARLAQMFSETSLQVQQTDYIESGLIENLSRQLNTVFLLSVVLGIIGLLSMLGVTAASIIQPLRKMLAAARRIEGGAGRARFPEEGPADLVELGSAFNHILNTQTDNERRLLEYQTELEKKVAALYTAENESKRYREKLEDQVRSRTLDLEKTNTELRGEINERRRAESQLRLQSSALQSVANAISITDHQGRVLWVNPAFTRLTGYALADISGRNMSLLQSGRHDSAFYREMWKTIASGQMWSGQLVNRRKDGSLYTEEMTITPVKNEAGDITYFVAVKQDISERQQLQQQLLQAQKMESVGRLAGGIAHDFNNQLTAILGFSEILRSRLDSKSSLLQDLTEIINSANRASTLTRQLLAFSRKQLIAPRVLDLNGLAEGMVKMLTRLLGEDIQLATDLEPTLFRTKADPSQIEHAVINLAINARDAMPQGGRLTLSTRNVHFGPREVAHLPDAREGRFVCLSISDTGSGMGPDVLEHLFEPFFTTKNPGQGTGLGLATSYGIVKQHEGWIHVYSQLGQGSTFKIYLPAIFSEEAETPEVRAATPRAGPAGHGQRILLVEDESGVRDLATRILREHQYEIFAAGSAADAIDLWGRENGRFDLLFTDVVLPDLNGLLVAERLLTAKPDMRVLLTSGYTDERARWPDIEQRGYRFLQKPYPATELLRFVSETLAGPPPRPPAPKPNEPDPS